MLLRKLAGRLDPALARCLERKGWQLRRVAARELNAIAERVLVRQRARLETLTARLAALDPRAVLARGFSIVRNAEGQVVRAATQVARGELVDLTFAAGSAQARIERSRP